MKNPIRLLAAFALLTHGTVFAQNSLLDEVRTVGADNAPAPVERVMSIPAAGNYELVLTDLGAPAAPLAEIRLAITRGKTVLGIPRTDPGVLAFTATEVGDHVVRVTGRPGGAPGAGLFRVQLRAAGATAVIDEFVDVLAPPPGAPNSGQYVFDASFTVPLSGNFNVVLRDLVWPQAMTTLIAAVVEEGGPLLAALDGVAGNPAQQTIALVAGRQYHVFAIAEPLSSTAGGLYSLRVSGGGVPFERNVGVAGVALLGEKVLAAGAHELVVGDLGFPAAAAHLGAHVLRDGQSVASTNAVGTTAFTAVAGLHQAFGFLEPTLTDGAGSMRAQIQPQGQPAVLSGVLPVALPGSGVTPYTFDGPVVAATYKLRLADYQFPAAFTSVGIAATQNGSVLGTPLMVPGAFDVTTGAGRVQLLVFARATPSGGLFGVDLVPNGGGATSIETTQGVGQLFTARKVSVTAAARYDVTLSDVGFPAGFDDLAAAVTRGSERVGLIFGPGKFDFSATPGNYFINVIARPKANESFGTYAISVAEKPPAPVVTFTATPGSAITGNSVELSWSATNATGCTASNGWTGAKAASGTERTAALTTAATYTLTCTGSGGDTAKTITVEVRPASGGGAGGGSGSLDPRTLLAVLGMLLFSAVARRARPARPASR
ncbi:MAG: hypothetical protein WDO72_17295 [Pseudomonadota bacterium]